MQLEAVVETTRPFGTRPDKPTTAAAFEVRIVWAHIDERILASGFGNRINPDRRRPLIMSFCRFYELGEQVHPSPLAQVPEELYRPVPRMTR